jgi:hypothetical protein
MAAPASLALAEQSLSVGYGFGLFNQNGSSTKLEGDKPYSLLQVLYAYEYPLASWFSLLAEPYAAYVFQPTDGFDVGLHVSGKLYFLNAGPTRLYFLAGTGAMYTSISFEEQSTHFLFILHGAIGIRYKNFFLENRFRHLSNGGTSTPNHSVHVNIVSIGMVF